MKKNNKRPLIHIHPSNPELLTPAMEETPEEFVERHLENLGTETGDAFALSRMNGRNSKIGWFTIWAGRVALPDGPLFSLGLSTVLVNRGSYTLARLDKLSIHPNQEDQVQVYQAPLGSHAAIFDGTSRRSPSETLRPIDIINALARLSLEEASHQDAIHFQQAA